VCPPRSRRSTFSKRGGVEIDRTRPSAETIKRGRSVERVSFAIHASNNAKPEGDHKCKRPQATSHSRTSATRYCGRSRSGILRLCGQLYRFGSGGVGRHSSQCPVEQMGAVLIVRAFRCDKEIPHETFSGRGFRRLHQVSASRRHKVKRSCRVLAVVIHRAIAPCLRPPSLSIP